MQVCRMCVITMNMIIFSDTWLYSLLSKLLKSLHWSRYIFISLLSIEIDFVINRSFFFFLLTIVNIVKYWNSLLHRHIT
jgi:hypothetical protein